jgi:hypothetical protein
MSSLRCCVYTRLIYVRQKYRLKIIDIVYMIYRTLLHANTPYIFSANSSLPSRRRSVFAPLLARGLAVSVDFFSPLPLYHRRSKISALDSESREDIFKFSSLSIHLAHTHECWKVKCIQTCFQELYVHVSDTCNSDQSSEEN